MVGGAGHCTGDRMRGVRGVRGAVSAISTPNVRGIWRVLDWNLTVCSRRVGFAPLTPLVPPGWAVKSVRQGIPVGQIRGQNHRFRAPFFARRIEGLLADRCARYSGRLEATTRVRFFWIFLVPRVVVSGSRRKCNLGSRISKGRVVLN
jgi:hypothetical protein